MKLYTGTLAYTPLTTTEPASYYWGINESITYGTTTTLAEMAGIVDTGTTLILLASSHELSIYHLICDQPQCYREPQRHDCKPEEQPRMGLDLIPSPRFTVDHVTRADCWQWLLTPVLTPLPIPLIVKFHHPIFATRTRRFRATSIFWMVSYLLKDIQNWISSTEEGAPHLSWLSGTADKGKSAVAHTNADWYISGSQSG
ncbi:uncharacterized protein F5147DRAFT_652769 [Suillus discolor]|uniref:Peptidase A1 domain-containing protein n=1 Tax=Suillus discolor TaxID=1912936 RepID=A0A9P7F8A7_9AGAM|nr:uncharacterized protein F5147DRAFT_652769 [Suillus discolor]KAG2108389.1 hypothetical protein F5147DRAFT_652769 [Suillus discolor]